MKGSPVRIRAPALKVQQIGIRRYADLKTPIELAIHELGIRVGVLNPHPPEKRSLDLRPAFFKQLRHGPIAASLFAPVLSDALGEIRKPNGW